MSHTPGPWYAEKDPDSSMESVVDAGRTMDPIYIDQERPTDSSANAALVAAAPNLKKVLEYVADMTYIGADGDAHFKAKYNPQLVVDAIASTLTRPRIGK